MPEEFTLDGWLVKSESRTLSQLGFVPGSQQSAQRLAHALATHCRQHQSRVLVPVPLLTGQELSQPRAGVWGQGLCDPGTPWCQLAEGADSLQGSLGADRYIIIHQRGHMRSVPRASNSLVVIVTVGCLHGYYVRSCVSILKMFPLRSWS